MSQLENINQRPNENPDKPRLDASNLFTGKGALNSIDKMEGFASTDNVPNFKLVSFAQSGTQNIHQRVANVMVSALDAVDEDNKLDSRSPEGNAIKTGMKIIFETEGDKAVDKLAGELTSKLPDGKKLNISTVDAKTKADMEEQARQRGEAAPEYIRHVELLDKEGKSLGSFDIGIAPASKELVAQLTKSKQLDRPSLSIIGDEISRRIAHGGPKEADALSKEITDKLPDGMQLKIVEDPEHVARVAAAKKAQGLPVPDYIRRIELLDKDGNLLGRHQHFMLTTPEQQQRQKNQRFRSA